MRYLVLGDRLELSIPAEAGSLGPLRGALRRWLRDGGATEEESYEILVAAGEACANAVRHGAATGAEDFEVFGQRNCEVSIVIRNPGRWRDGGVRPGSNGGRGLGIMSELMDEVEVKRGPPETVVALRRTLAIQRPPTPAGE